MKKQTQSRQYGYVSPKCKFAQVPTGMAFCASPGGVGDLNNQGLHDLINGEGVKDDSNSWGY